MLIQSEHARFIARLNKVANGLQSDYSGQTDIAMKTSARNQFAGIIVSILQGPVNDEVTLMMNGSAMLVASITHGSCRELNLDIGAKVFALIKASSIALHAVDDPQLKGRRNALVGTAHTVTQGPTRSEVELLVDNGLNFVCTVPNDAVERLKINLSAKLVAVIDPTNIIISIAA